MITVKNLRQSKPEKPWQVKIDRQSVLGNPFYMRQESDRAKVCKQYAVWFLNRMKRKSAISTEIQRLHELHKQYGKLELFCWCAPKQCHGDSIKKYLDLWDF